VQTVVTDMNVAAPAKRRKVDNVYDKIKYYSHTIRILVETGN